MPGDSSSSSADKFVGMPDIFATFKEKKIGDASSDSSDSDVSSYNSLSKVLYVVEEESKESGSMVSKKFDKL